MAISAVLLDTNAYVAFKQGKQEALEIVQRATQLALSSTGQPIPSNDMWIAAAALQHGYALFSYDRHFQSVDGLLVGATPADLLL